ncbi:MAG: hypothetical protein KDA21_11080, partial [Phycisphaerales bacterium]|nr:hypothetical protein [Phycisphaerales bacterium]
MDTTINTSQPHTTWSASPAASHVTQTSSHVDDVPRVQSTATREPVSDGMAVPAPEQSDPGDTVAAWIKELASSGPRFDESMRRLLGEAWTSEAADKIRELITSGEMKQILATPADREAPTPGVESPMNATQTIADGVGARLAATVGVSVSPEVSRAFGAELDPARQGELTHYLTHVPGQEPAAPVLFETAGLEYTSNPVGTNGFVSVEGIEKDYIAGWIGTPPEIAEMDDAGIANMLSPEWRTAVVKAARQNGGLGNSTDGFLAFSRDVGFVRLRNPRLSPEQNRRLAEMSLTMGVSIDTLPSRAHESSFTRDNIDHWVNEIIGRYDEQIEQFRNDPTDAVEVKDGSKRYVMKLHEESGRVISYDYKKHGGVKGFAQKHMDIIGPVLDVASIVVNFVPGLGQGAALGIQGLKTGLSAAAYGKLTAGHVAGLAGTVLPGLAQSGVLSATQAGAINGALNAGAQYIDTGNFDAASLVSALSPSLIHGLPGGPAVDRIVQNGLEMTADAIVHGRINPSDALS